jgi:protein-S-isoprenylcysteine O-methyltransferase Ste14
MDEPRDDHAQVRFFPPGIGLITILLGVLLQRVWPLGRSMFPDAPLRYWIGFGLFVASVLGLGAWAVILFRRSGQNENPWKPTPAIVERGPYRFTRNPMYLQMVLGCIGFAIALANLWILLLTPVCALMLQILAIGPEEAYLERKFGAEYLAYKQRVRRWL